MIQNVVVGLLVVLAGLYTVWILLPDTARRRAAASLASLANRCGLADAQAQRLRARLATHSSCGACESCKGCASALEKKTAALQQLPPSSGPAQPSGK